MKVGVAIGGRSQSGSGVTDFHVKSLEEIRAEKRRRRQTAREQITTTPAVIASAAVVGENNDG